MMKTIGVFGVDGFLRQVIEMSGCVPVDADGRLYRELPEALRHRPHMALVLGAAGTIEELPAGVVERRRQPPHVGAVWDALAMGWVDQRSQTDRDAELGAAARQTRDRLLAACDWTQAVDVPFSAAARAVWVAYRQALRDVTAQPGFPLQVLWPTAPGM